MVDPTPASTPFPVPPSPYPEPTPHPASEVDLKPYFGDGEPLVVRNPHGGPFVQKSDLVLDWAIENDGTSTLIGSYFVDVYLDDILAERWIDSQLSTVQVLSVEGFTELLDLFNLEPGTHTLKLVADSTGQINEISESNNTRTTEFTWSGQPLATPTANERLPNLSVVGNAGEKPSMIVSPFTGADTSGGLSIHGDTQISISILNDSPITIDRGFAVHVMFDDIVVHRASYTGLVGGSTLVLEWGELASTVPLTTGQHTIKLVLDPTGIIAESDETDNSIELELIWGAHFPLAMPDPPPASDAPVRPNQALPNLTGYTKYGWDAAVSVSRTTSGLPAGRDGPVWASDSATISFAVRNNSRVSTSTANAFRVDVFVDDDLFGSQLFSTGNDSGAVWSGSVEVPADQLAAGQRLVKIVIDSEQAIPEDAESDNLVARWVNWLPGAPVTDSAEDFVLSAAQIDDLLAPILERAFADQVRPVVGSGLELPDWVPEIEAAGRAGYYLLTGRDLDEERIVMHFLPHDQFVAASLDACMTDYLLLTGPVYASNFVFCRDFKGEVGFKSRLNGSIHVYVDLGESPLQALSTYFHEVGHALQDLTNPLLSEAPRTANLKGLLEAQAQIFEAAALRAIEEHAGISLMKFPDNPAMESAVNFSLDSTNALEGSPEHSLGYKMLWMESLTDSSGIGTDTEMLTSTHLSSASAKGIYDFLVAMQPGEIESWIKSIFAVSTRADKFMQRSRDRLRSNLPTSDWGNPGLLEPAFLAP